MRKEVSQVITSSTAVLVETALAAETAARIVRQELEHYEKQRLQEMEQELKLLGL